jgi:hypothetical protein
LLAAGALGLASIFAPSTLRAQTAATTAPSPAQAAPPSKPAPDKAAPSITWKRIPEADRKVLAPLEADWSTYSGVQQRRLLGAAKAYPKLSPVEQERFQERLRAWSKLTPEQRKSARDQFQSLANLPPERQEELKARWQQERLSDKARSGPEKAETAPGK